MKNSLILLHFSYIHIRSRCTDPHTNELLSEQGGSLPAREEPAWESVFGCTMRQTTSTERLTTFSEAPGINMLGKQKRHCEYQKVKCGIN